MKTGLIIPTYPFEKRVALLPDDIYAFPNELVIETGFGDNLEVSDQSYIDKGCSTASREEIFKTCDSIFCLKLMQPSDYPYLRKGQLISGWTHPTGSGAAFFNTVAQDLKLLIADLDNIYPSLFFGDKKIAVPWIPRDFIRENSVMAGTASTLHAIVSYGLYPDSNTKVAILAPGNVSQGAYQVMAKLGCNIRLFYRKTMNEFYDSIDQYDIIINGIEVDDGKSHIISLDQQDRIKRGALLIDAAADAGNAIEGTHYTSIGDPIYLKNGLAHYEVNNSPSILYRKASEIISKSLSKWVFSRDFKDYFDLVL